MTISTAIILSWLKGFLHAYWPGLLLLVGLIAFVLLTWPAIL